MDIGMLWFDNDKKTDYQAKVARAAAYYREKYGKAPNLCFVHPSTLAASGTKQVIVSQGVEIRPATSMLPNHFWIGVHRGERTQ